MKGSRATKAQMKKEQRLLTTSSLPEEAMKGIKKMAENMAKKGMPPKQAVGVSDKLLEGIYGQAYRLYNTGKYIEATHLFRMLILMDATQSKYILGLAACFHMMKEYNNAIKTYTMVSVVDPENPLPYYHSSDCFVEMKDLLSAILCLEMAIAKAGDKPEFSKLKERAIMNEESLKQQTGDFKK